MAFGIVAVFGSYRPCTAEDQEATHKELRQIRDEMMAAFNARDINALLKHVHPNVVVTWQNAEVSRGHDGLREFYQKMMEGESSRVKNVSANLGVDELSIIYGDHTAIAFGTLDETFELRHGLNFDLANRWTATLIHDQGKWQLAAFQVSTNMFENGLQERLLQWNTIKSGGISLTLGILMGLAIAKVSRRRNAEADE